jgi:hypothetical protein
MDKPTAPKPCRGYQLSIHQNRNQEGVSRAAGSAEGWGRNPVSDTDRVIKNLIMGDVADDYEEFEHVLKNVTASAADRGISVDRQVVFDKLKELVKEGRVRAYVYLTKQQSFAETAECSADRIDDLWFYITPKGLEVFEPFGEE